VKLALLADAGSIHTRRWSAGLHERGHDVRIVTNGAARDVPTSIPVDVLPGSSSLGYVLAIPGAKKIIKQFHPDIVHVHYATGYGLWGTAQNIAPLVVTVWGTDVADALAGRFMVAPVVCRALRKARCVTAPSKFLMAQTVHLEPSVKDKIVHIPFGLPKLDYMQRSDRDNDTVRIVFAKQYRHTYGPDLVIKAFAAALETAPQIRLLMLGGGPMRKELERLAASLSLASKIDLRDWTEPDETQQLICESDIMVMPSRRESFGVAALEASAAGVPVIAADVGGVPEIVHHEQNGLLVPVDDADALAEAIVRLAGDPGLRKRMGDAGRTIVRNEFPFDHCLDLMEEVYRKAAAG